MHFKSSLQVKYKINKISEIATDQLSEFYKKTYYKRYKSLTSNWRWWYRVGYNELEPLILSVDNKVIGQAAYLPINLNILGNIVPAIWFVDYVVLPEFKGKGLGKILSKEWMKICPNQMAICSDDSLRVLKKLGWKDNYTTKRLARPISTLKFLPILKNLKLNFVNRTLRYFIKKKYSRDISINPYKISDNFKIINDSFKLRKIVKNNEFAEIIRDEKWLHWRLIECPYKKDIYFFEYKNNFAIVHIFVIENIKKLNILYTYSADKLQENELFVQIINWSINNNIDLVWAVSRNTDFENIFPKIFNKPLQFASWSSDEKIFKTLQNGLSNLQGIDTDNDSWEYAE
jgi:GNAT superfamily N-acetyltransferase